MATITKYFDPQGAQITTQWWADSDGTRHHVAALTDEQRQALGITTMVEEVAPPPPPSLVDMKAARIAEINFECRSRIVAVWPIEKQISALAGIYGPAELQAMTDFIDAHIAASNVATSAVFDLPSNSTQQQVEAVTVAWPV